jgi:hypothetical protein
MAEETTTQESTEEVLDAENPFETFLEHQRKAFEEAGKALESLLPETFKQHGEAAFKEAIEGYRKLFNAAMDEIKGAVGRVVPSSGGSEENPYADDEATTGATKVRVEVE